MLFHDDFFAFKIHEIHTLQLKYIHFLQFEIHAKSAIKKGYIYICVCRVKIEVILLRCCGNVNLMLLYDGFFSFIPINAFEKKLK